MSLPEPGDLDWGAPLNNAIQAAQSDAAEAKAESASAQSNANHARNVAESVRDFVVAPVDEQIASQVADDDTAAAEAVDARVDTKVDPIRDLSDETFANNLSASTVARVTPSQHAPALGVFFPEAEGAVGNGTADDTTAVQAALDAIGAAGGTGVLHCERTYKVTDQLTLTAPNPGLVNWAKGGVKIMGYSALQSRIVSTYAGTLFDISHMSFVHFEDVLIDGPGIAVAGSKAIAFDTVPRITMDRVMIRDFEVGISWYDCTGGVYNNLHVHYCGTGAQAGYNFDCHTFDSSDFKYCGTGFQLGWDAGESMGTGDDQFCNAVTFLDTMFSYCTVAGITIPDKAARGIGFLGAYWEGNPLDVVIGVSGRSDLRGPDISFERCFFSATVSPPIAVGIQVYGRPDLHFKNCATDGDNRYTVFVKMNDVNGGTCTFDDGCRINAVTAALQVGSRNFNTTVENREAIRYGRVQGDYIDTVNAPASVPLKQTRAYNAGNRIIEAWGRSTTAGAVTSDLRIEDHGGVLRLQGETAAFIAGTRVTSLPTAGANYYGSILFLVGGSGAADVPYMCLLDDAGTYVWTALVGTPGAAGPSGSGNYALPRTVHPGLIAPSGSTTGAANRIRFIRVTDSGTITKISMNQTTAGAGNMKCAVYRNNGSTGRAARPDGAPLGTSAAVNTNLTTGIVDITLGSSVAVDDGDWFAFAVDNNTAAFALANGSSGSSAIDGFGYYYDAANITTLPTISGGSISSTPITANGRLYGMWGG